MELTKQQKTLKYICYCLIIIAADLMQNTSGLFPEIAGARCFLLLPAAIILAMGEDERNGALLGLFAGLLWDLSSGTHMGFNCIFIMVFCFFSSALITYAARDTFITNMLCCAVTIVLYCTIYWLCFIIIKGVEGAELTLFSFYIPCMLYTLILSPVIWLVLKPIKKKLNKA